MKKLTLVLSVVLSVSVLTGCVKTLTSEEDNAPVIYEETGQRLTENIVCQPTNEEVNELYRQHNVDIESLPTCEDLTLGDGMDVGIWTGILVTPLAKLILTLGGIFNTYGIGIILSAMIVRLLLYPITRKSTHSMQKMQEIQPKIQRIQDKYGKNPDRDASARMQQEIMALYQKHGVNPLSGCVTPFLQMPILIAFYEAIYRTPAIFENTFLGLELGLTPSVAFGIGQYQYIILILLAAGSTYISSKYSMGTQQNNNNNANNPMKSMTTIMPLMIGFFAWTLPAALSIYWTTSNLLTLATTFVTKHRPHGK
jgi:YidC/Oxa1 family membrane protein insertase